MDGMAFCFLFEELTKSADLLKQWNCMGGKQELQMLA